MRNTNAGLNRRGLAKGKQSGLSLIEMMIAMLIGLFLLLGITTSYLSSKKSSFTRDQISILEDNGRAALEILTKTLEHTGYKSTGLIPLNETFKISANKPVSTNCGGGENSILDPLIFPDTSISDSDTAGDSIGVVYLGDDDLFTDCAGGILPVACRVGTTTNAKAPQIFNTFFIEGDKLQCVGSRSAAREPIAEGVENIQFLYGLNVDGDLYKSVDRYVKASDVTDWGLVVSIQVAILIRSSKEVKNKAETQSFSLLDVPVVSANDRYQRAVFSTTINLRNQ